MKNTILTTLALLIALSFAALALTACPPEPTPDQTPTAADFDIDNLTQTEGNVTAVTITPKNGKSGGAITIYYDGSTTLPTTANTYPVTFDVAASTGWNEAIGLIAGTLTINGVNPAPCACLATYGEYTHLDEGETCNCGGDNCTDCTVKVSATLSNGTTKVWKEAGADIEAFNAVVEALNDLIIPFPDFGNNFTEVRVVAGSGISHQGTVLRIGDAEEIDTTVLYIMDNDLWVAPPAAHTHTYSATWSKDATQHWRECTANDGAKTDVANHSGDPCTVCGYASSAHTHEWEWQVTTPATAEADGLETETCKTCGETSGNTRTIPMLPHTHTPAATWSSDAAQHWRECTANDGAKIDAANHTPGGWIVDQPASADTAGSKHTECTVCGYVTATQAIPQWLIYEDLYLTKSNGAHFPVILEDQSGQLTAERVGWIQDSLTQFCQSISGSDTTAVANLAGRGANDLRIIIEDIYGGPNHRVIDYRTFALRYEVVSQIVKDGLYAVLRDALRATGSTPVGPVPCRCRAGTTHEPNQRCCNGTGCACEVAEPADKTHTVTIRDGALTFDIKYKALPSAPLPGYVAYIQERLEMMDSNIAPQAVASINNLIDNGGSEHTIIVEYTGDSYEGLDWNTVARIFTIHYDWVSGASGTDLSATMFRGAFNSVEAE